MCDDSVFKSYGTQAELIKIKEELKKFQKQNDELKDQMASNNLMKIFDDFQAKCSGKLEAIQENVNVLSTRVSNSEKVMHQMIVDNAAHSKTISNRLDILQNYITALSEHFNVLSSRVFNNNERLSEVKETSLKQSAVLWRLGETLTDQNETIQILKNNLEKETILLFGGYNGINNLDSVLILENNGENWKQLGIKLPEGTAGHGSQFFNNDLYLFGGQNSNEEVLNFTYKLSKSLHWIKMADMNEKRSFISNSSVILNDRLWVCGGSNGKSAWKSVEMYNPVAKKWEYKREMNQCRSHAAAVVVSGRIYCCGGADDIAYTTFLTSVECYDPYSNVWTLMCDMPEPIRGCCAVAMDESLIVMGNYGDGEYLTGVWVFDTTDENEGWIKKSCMPRPRSYFNIARAGNKIFACGGDAEEGIVDDVDIFIGGHWRNGPKLTTVRKYTSSTTVPIDLAKYLK